MKKVLSMAMVLFLLFSTFSIVSFAATTASATVYVTISDANGKLVLKQEPISVTDTDNDGSITIHDALYAAHESKYTGGAAAGYASSATQYGMSLDKLWGTSNGGSYGYYVNNTSAIGLTDKIKNGDYLNAFVYTDLTAWTDTYCYFNINTVAAAAKGEITLTLSAAGYDANYAPVTLPVSGATITLNGTTTAYKTDANGKVTIKIADAGKYVISATSDSQTLVPPVCVATVEASATDNPATGDNSVVFGFAIISISFMGIITVSAKRRRSYEK